MSSDFVLKMLLVNIYRKNNFNFTLWWSHFFSGSQHTTSTTFCILQRRKSLLFRACCEIFVSFSFHYIQYCLLDILFILLLWRRQAIWANWLRINLCLYNAKKHYRFHCDSQDYLTFVKVWFTLSNTLTLLCKLPKSFVLFWYYCNSTQCVPGFSNPNQKVHGLFHFYVLGICKTDQI